MLGQREIQQNEEQVFGLEAVMSPGQEKAFKIDKFLKRRNTLDGTVSS